MQSSNSPTYNLNQKQPTQDEEEEFYSIVSDQNLFWEIQNVQSTPSKQSRQTFSFRKNENLAQPVFKIQTPQEAFKQLEHKTEPKVEKKQQPIRQTRNMEFFSTNMKKKVDENIMLFSLEEQEEINPKESEKVSPKVQTKIQTQIQPKTQVPVPQLPPKAQGNIVSPQIQSQVQLKTQTQVPQHVQPQVQVQKQVQQKVKAQIPQQVQPKPQVQVILPQIQQKVELKVQSKVQSQFEQKVEQKVEPVKEQEKVVEIYQSPSKEMKKQVKELKVESKSSEVKIKVRKTEIIIAQPRQKEDSFLKEFMPNIRGKCLFRQASTMQYRKVEYIIESNFIAIGGYDEELQIKWIKNIKMIAAQNKYFELKIMFVSQGNRANRGHQTHIYLYDNYKGIFTLFSGIIVRTLYRHAIKFDEKLVPHVHIEPSPPEVQQVLYKKSKHLKKWQKRKILINQEGLKSFRNEKCTIQIKKIQALVTTFHIHDGYFVIRIYQQFQKTDIGIPICNFMNGKSKMNWLQALCYLFFLQK